MMYMHIILPMVGSSTAVYYVKIKIVYLNVQFMLITPLQSFNFKKDCSVGIQKFYLMEINFQVIHYTCSLGKKRG